MSKKHKNEVVSSVPGSGLAVSDRSTVPEFTQEDVVALAARVAQLEADKARLEAKLNDVDAKSKSRFSWRKVLAGTLILAGCISLTAANLSAWADRTLVDNDVYVETVAPIASNPAVQAAIQAYAFQELTARVDFEQIVTDVLPEKADILAAPLAGQLKNYSNQLIGEVVRSKQFAQVWVTVNSTVHEELIATVTNYEGDGTVNVSQLYSYISKQLEDTPLKILANQTLPANVGDIKLFNVSQLKTAHDALVRLHEIRIWSLIITILSFAGAVLVSQRRMHTLMIVGISSVFTMIVLVVVALVGRTYALDQITNPVNREAALAIWTILMRGLFDQTKGIMALGFVIALGSWIATGRGNIANLRKTLSLQSSQVMHSIWKDSRDSSFVKWLDRFKYYVEWGIIVLAVAVLIMVPPLSYGVVFGVSMGAMVAILIVEFIASAKLPEIPAVLPASSDKIQA
jgi:hypothetical protein